MPPRLGIEGFADVQIKPRRNLPDGRRLRSRASRSFARGMLRGLGIRSISSQMLPPHVPDPHFIGAGSERKPKGIAEPVAHDAAGVGVGIGEEGIIGQGLRP